ncbi:hypothetical protein Daus18300_007615 [Diaporthe australafricana]|uniref:Aminoglycoside phosphotransferase domain-containing protein n=1 Tax=Diaporthe australafricana TaxID=127596 RepID=A0ABR3WLY5_9PEZI
MDSSPPSSVPTIPACPSPLPTLSHGPRLEPFRGTATADIEFCQLLSNEDDFDSQVWEVRIDGDTYALKIFYFRHWEWLEELDGGWITPPEYDPLSREPLTPDEYVDYLDPFNCECRAYARIKQEHREDVAVRAHGYLLLTLEQERHISKGELETDDQGSLKGGGPWGRWEWQRHQRLRAIVKNFVPVDTGYFDESHLSGMWSDLELLHSLGILVRDIHPGNYMDGKLIDLSRAWTMYHPCIDRTLPDSLKKLRKDECKRFTDMIRTWSVIHGVAIEVPQGSDAWESDNKEDFGIDPTKYDWRKWEELATEDQGKEQELC